MDEFSKRLGQHISWRKVRTPKARPENRQEYEWVPQGATWLRTGVELARESSRDSGRALVFFEGGDVSLVRRAAYDWLFTNKDYSPNPYVTEPAFFSRAGIRAEGGIQAWWDALMEKMIYGPLDRRWKGWLGPWLEKYAAWGEKKEQEWREKKFKRGAGRPADQSLDEFREQDEQQQAPVADSPPPAAPAPEPEMYSWAYWSKGVEALKEQERADREKQQAGARTLRRLSPRNPTRPRPPPGQAPSRVSPGTMRRNRPTWVCRSP